MGGKWKNSRAAPFFLDLLFYLSEQKKCCTIVLLKKLETHLCIWIHPLRTGTPGDTCRSSFQLCQSIHPQHRCLGCSNTRPDLRGREKKRKKKTAVNNQPSPSSSPSMQHWYHVQNYTITQMKRIRIQGALQKKVEKIQVQQVKQAKYQYNVAHLSKKGKYLEIKRQQRPSMQCRFWYVVTVIDNYQSQEK